MAQAKEIQVSPEEHRFLRRFFRRQALPWLVALALLAVASARLAVPAAAPGVLQRLDEAMAKIEALERQNAVLRTEVEAMGQHLPGSLERRLASAEERIAAMERRPAASGRDPGDVAERVARIEERLASTANAQETVTRSNLSRLRDLESRMDAIAGDAGSAPAAPAP
jgi:hypothetical protein